MYFNNEIKLEYMNTVSTSIQYIINNLFNKSLLYEDMKQKDICDFVEDEIIEFLTGLASSSINTLCGYASLLRSYTQWCCDNNINKDHINHFDSINVNVLSNCINYVINQDKYITLTELKDIMDSSIVNACDKFLVYAIFCGITGKDAIELTNVTEDSVDKNTNMIKLATGRKIKIPYDLCDLISESCNEYQYILTSGKKFDTLKLDETDNTAFKRRSNARFSTQERARLRVVSRLTKLRETTGCVSLTTDRLRNSGILHYMKEAMKEKGISKDEIYQSDEMKRIQGQYDILNQPSFQLKAKYKDFL